MKNQALKDRIDAKNIEIDTCLNAEIVDVELLNKLVERRHEDVVQLLENLDTDAAKTFAESEIKTQKNLDSRIKDLFENTKTELSTFLKARKLAAKYK